MPPVVLTTEMLTAIAAKLSEQFRREGVPWQDVALNLRLAARLVEKMGSLRFRLPK
jgi:hypothetical protein